MNVRYGVGIKYLLLLVSPQVNIYLLKRKANEGEKSKRCRKDPWPCLHVIPLKNVIIIITDVQNRWMADAQTSSFVENLCSLTTVNVAQLNNDIKFLH